MFFKKWINKTSHNEIKVRNISIRSDLITYSSAVISVRAKNKRKKKKKTTLRKVVKDNINIYITTHNLVTDIYLMPPILELTNNKALLQNAFRPFYLLQKPFIIFTFDLTTNYQMKNVLNIKTALVSFSLLKYMYLFFLCSHKLNILYCLFFFLMKTFVI